MNEVYDSIIVGAGPAGLSASIYLARKKLNFIILTEELGGQIAKSGSVENYPGFSQISGQKLIDRIVEQAKSNGVSITYEQLKSIAPEGDNFLVETDKNKYVTKSAIISGGKTPIKLNVSGEEKLTGKGVAYCATCDAPLFKDKKVAVIGAGNSALDTVLQLSKYTKDILLISNCEKLKCDLIMEQKIKEFGFVKIIYNAETLAIKGENLVSGVILRDIKTGDEKEISVDGVFITIGWQPSTDFEMPCKKNDKNEIIVDKNCQTSIPGIFAAGDITDILAKQSIVATGEGAKAALGVYKHLNENQ